MLGRRETGREVLEWLKGNYRWGEEEEGGFANSTP